jgi:hypothetical protein
VRKGGANRYMALPAPQLIPSLPGGWVRQQGADVTPTFGLAKVSRETFPSLQTSQGDRPPCPFSGLHHDVAVGTLATPSCELYPSTWATGSAAARARVPPASSAGTPQPNPSFPLIHPPLPPALVSIRSPFCSSPLSPIFFLPQDSPSLLLCCPLVVFKFFNL